MFIQQLTVKVLSILSFRTSPTEEKIVLKETQVRLGKLTE